MDPDGWRGSHESAPRGPLLLNDRIVKSTDRKLIQACRKGDARAWRLLLNKYERLVYSIPLRYGLSRDDADDVKQVTFMILIQSLDELPEDSRLGAWLSTVARRHTWRRLERKQREDTSKHLEGSEFTEVAALLGKSDAETVEHWELAEWLETGLSKLSEFCREFLLALYLQPEQPSYREVAARFGKPVGSIGPTRARCLKSLRKALDGG